MRRPPLWVILPGTIGLRREPMSVPSVLDRVLQIVTSVAGPTRTPAGAGPDTPLCDGGFWLDSIALVEIVTACEAEFQLDFDPATEIPQAAQATPRKLAAMIEARNRHG